MPAPAHPPRDHPEPPVEGPQCAACPGRQAAAGPPDQWRYPGAAGTPAQAGKRRAGVRGRTSGQGHTARGKPARRYPAYG
jgi:hypothetical protein